ncbi:hypothetical protein PG993_014567 [Apiospora rasikravindrae]|uniref:Uncharacterized protein n=1 Tax=Apiospora rasikravindrae TaxID=990691 RepID=A0ABR1RN53_9PEZI
MARQRRKEPKRPKRSKRSKRPERPKGSKGRKRNKGHKGHKDADKLKENLPKQGMHLDSPTALSHLGTLTMAYFAKALRGEDKEIRSRHITNNLPGLFFAGATRIGHDDAASERPQDFWKHIVDEEQTWARTIPGNVVLEFVLYMMQARREFLVSGARFNDESEYVTAIDLFEDNLKRYHIDNRFLIAQYKATSRGQRDDDLLEEGEEPGFSDDDAGFEDNTSDAADLQESEEEDDDDDDEDEDEAAPPSKKREREEDVDDEAASEPTGPPVPRRDLTFLRAGIKRMKLEGLTTPQDEEELLVEIEDARMS